MSTVAFELNPIVGMRGVWAFWILIPFEATNVRPVLGCVVAYISPSRVLKLSQNRNLFVTASGI